MNYRNLFMVEKALFDMYRPEDHIQQIANYLKNNISKGYTMDSLKFSLMGQGYSRISVEKAVELANEQLAQKAPILKEKPQIVYRAIPAADMEEEQGFFKKLFRRFFN